MIDLGIAFRKTGKVAITFQSRCYFFQEGPVQGIWVEIGPVFLKRILFTIYIIPVLALSASKRQ
jgi:hypothetical protein